MERVAVAGRTHHLQTHRSRPLPVTHLPPAHRLLTSPSATRLPGAALSPLRVTSVGGRHGNFAVPCRAVPCRAVQCSACSQTSEHTRKVDVFRLFSSIVGRFGRERRVWCLRSCHVKVKTREVSRSAGEARNRGRVRGGGSKACSLLITPPIEPDV
ncbi:hypothetical protein E2C01_032195 [Portunus trituberculatus]|uniref:Uncharacterized protein n=1 Tax=Portunus trituberculatus TaxID=210409 RepID=A0A5B7F0Q3_PORTR|nr:hypothetical protein [Portunus trituberculatus]